MTTLFPRIADADSTRQAVSTPRILAPLIVAALLRIALMLAAFPLTGTAVMTQGDTSSYLQPGRNLILHGVFASSGAAEIDRTPGYPIFAELTGMLFDNVLLTVAAQIVLSLLSLLLVRRIADRIFPNRDAGIIAAWLYAIEPLSIVSTVRLMPETLFVLLLLLIIERILTYQKTGKLAALAIAGVSLAAATYVRPASYYLAFPLALGLAATAEKQNGLRWKAPAVLLITVLPFLAAWQLRNSLETGYTGFSSIVEKNLYFFQSAEINAQLDHVSLAAEQDKLGYADQSAWDSQHPEQRTWTQRQRLQFMRAESLRILSRHRAIYLKSHLKGVAVVAFTPGAAELLQLLAAYPASDSMPRRIVNEGLVASTLRTIRSHPSVTILMAALEAFLLLLYAFAIRGCLVANPARIPLFTVLGVALYFLLISGGAQAVGRYRVPIAPELCILAAGGLAPFQSKEKRGHHSPALETLKSS
jgi:4-amino-4-deoxy-L-arabinose transferase-like glycosyltransferase